MEPSVTESRVNGRPLRVLIVVNVYYPDRAGGAAVFTDLARGLASRGLDVTVRCAYPYYPEWEDKSGRNGRRVQRYEEEGVTVERFGLYIPSDPNSLTQRLAYEASFLASLARSLPRDARAGAEGRFDVTMVFCPLMGAVAYGAMRKRFFGDRLWLNVQDISADAAAASGIATGRGAIAALTRVQEGLFNRYDTWSTISPEMVRRLAPMRRRAQPLLYLPNWLNASMAEVVDALPDKVGRPAGEPPRLLYAGNIGTKQDLLALCQRLHASPVPFEFRIHGSGGRADDVRAWVEASGDDRFVFGDFLDEPGFVRAIHDADLFLISEKADSGGSFIPSKLIPAIATGTPLLVVSDADSPVGQEVLEHELGPHFEWDALDALERMLGAMPEQPMARWQQSARERSAFYRRDAVLDRFQEVFAALANGRAIPAAAEPLPA